MSSASAQGKPMPKRSNPQSISFDTGENKMFRRLMTLKTSATGAMVSAAVALSTVAAWADDAPAAAPAAAAAAAAPPPPSGAASAVLALNAGDTAWMLTSTALVLLMTVPGLALFYAGMVRKKNILATAAQSFAITALVT